ncbi:hypothetical protein EPR50_G00014460 [Perca flavescens]|uniref:Uncharacterized protein n=3 Tax=Perca flavescens TaxID=8167 RepID=A0A484DK64_PERFV|nr:hypothetical protein EPR50_G00014460 [Perca flavescens]
MANIVECEAMMSQDESALHNVRTFKRLYEARWTECVSTHALRNLKEAKWNAPTLLPFTEDVKRMHKYIDEQRIEYQTKLLEAPNKKSWSDLANLTLGEIILFNRRREGEVAKMPLKAFTVRDTASVHPDVEIGLTDLEKKLCRYFKRIEIQGKRQRKVPIILTPNMLSSMEALVENRIQCGVPNENHFLFARPEARTHLRGSDAIRQLARKCGAKHPEALSSTKLRKHVATMSKVLNLRDNEMDDLADFLGHDIRVHRQFYRLPEGTLQLAKISKVLVALERGQMSEFKGRNLDEISIDPNEEMAGDSNLSENEECEMTPDQLLLTAGSRRKRKCTTEVESDSDSQDTTVCPVSKTATKKRPDNKKPVGEDKSPGESQITKGSSKMARRKWSTEEVQAVESNLMDNINSGRVPGKAQCEACIKASSEALMGRSWQAVKFYVKNRIDTLKRLEKN